VLTASRLRQRLSYDPDTGEFTWIIPPRGRSVGAIAGRTAKDDYSQIQVDGRRYQAHRLAWLYVHGTFPEKIMDHIDGDRSNNRINNLRPATNSQNGANERMKSQNTSGYKGVSWFLNKWWKAQISYRGKVIYLGHFDCPKEAHAAYMAAARKYHGEFARAA
jgi:hypothetical protein